MTDTMFWLLLATGFSGGLTLVFAARWVARATGLAPSGAAYFSPPGGLTAAVVAQVRKAKREVLVQAYSLTSPAVADALVQAHKRKVKVTVILDAAHEKAARATVGQLWEAGLEPVLDRRLPAHSKVLIIDGRTLITGSFDFTADADEKRADNLLVLRRHADLVQPYREHFLKQEAELRGPAAPAPAPAAPVPKPAVSTTAIAPPPAKAQTPPAPVPPPPPPPTAAPKPPLPDMIPLNKSAAPPPPPPTLAPPPLPPAPPTGATPVIEPIPLKRAA
jgi:hypothetical protein